MTERQTIERLKELRKKSGNIDTLSEEEKIKQIEYKKKWMTYYRDNIEIYLEKRMGFHSYGYQNFSYHLMNEAQQYIEVSTRGVGKSLRVIAFASARALLYPNSKIGVTAVGASQANENFLTAFMQELILKPYSPFMNWLYNNGLIKTKLTDKGYVATFWNGSIIYFFPCIDSSRGLHVDTLIGEEVRLIKKADWDSIAMPMLVKRQASYRNRPEYYERTDLDEKTKVLCITSNRFKNEWFNTMYKNTTIGYFKERFTNNRAFSVDIFSAIKHGLKDEEWYLKQQKEMDEISFRAEILNETIGEVEGAYFTLDMIRKNQLLEKPFYPVTKERYSSGDILKFRKPHAEEIRLLFVDFAFAGGDKNDNTSIGCLSAYPKGNTWVKNVDYITTLNGGDGDNALLQIREMYHDYKANYIVFDKKNGGDVHYNTITKEFIHPTRSSEDWNTHGFTVSNETDLQVVSKSILDDLVGRTNDPDAIPCLIPIAGHPEFNSIMWQELNKAFRDSSLHLLIDKTDYEQKNFEESLNMSSEDKREIMLPFVQTSMLIGEAINLTATFKANGLVSLSEGTNPNATKDRIVSLGYGNLIMNKIINKVEKNRNQQNDIDWDTFQLVY